MEFPGTRSECQRAAAGSTIAGACYEGVIGVPTNFSGALLPRTAIEYAEIFCGIASSCTIPILDLPTAGRLDACAAPFSPIIDYDEIFRDFEGADFALTYEELLLEQSSWDSLSSSSASKESLFSQQTMEGLKQNLQCPDIDDLPHAQNSGVFSSKNNLSADIKKFDVLISEPSLGSPEEETSKGMKTQKGQVNEFRNFVPDSGFSQGENHDNHPPKATSPCRHSEDMDREMTTVSLSSGRTSLKSHSLSSRFNMISNDDIFAPDATYVTISGIDLLTEPVQGPPPSRPPPKVYGNRGHPRIMMHTNSKSERVEKTSNMSKFDHSDYLVDGDLKCHVARDKLKNGFSFDNVEVDTSSAMAMEVAIVQDQDKLRRAKELMERRRLNVPGCKNLNECKLKYVKAKGEEQVVEEKFKKAKSELCEILMMNGQNVREASHVDKYEMMEVCWPQNGDLKCSHPDYLFEGRRAEWKTNELFHELTKNNFQSKPATRDSQNKYIHKKFTNSSKANVCPDDDKSMDFFSVPIREREILNGNVCKAHIHEDNRDIVNGNDDDGDDGKILRDEKVVREVHFSEIVEMQSNMEKPTVKGSEGDMFNSCEKVDCCEVSDERTTKTYGGDKEIENGHKIIEVIDIPKTLHKSYNEGCESKSHQVSQRHCINGTEETISRPCMEFERKAEHILTDSRESVVAVRKECAIGVAEGTHGFLEKVEEIGVLSQKIEHVDLESELNIREPVVFEAKLNVMECEDGDMAKYVKITPTVKKMKGMEEMATEALKRNYQKDLNGKKAEDKWVENVQRKEKCKTRITVEEEFNEKLKIEEDKERENKRLVDLCMFMDLNANDDVKILQNFFQQPCEDSEVVLKISAAECSNAFPEEHKEERAIERKLEEVREREREREKDRLFEACEKSRSESQGRSEKFSAERVKTQQSQAETEENLEKASSHLREHNGRFNASKDGRKNIDRTGDARISDRRDCATNLVPKSSVMRSSTSSEKQPYHVFSAKPEGAGADSPLRCKARLERHQRTVERAAKALAEMHKRDIFARREQAERNRLAESLDTEIKRWSKGKEGNLRALLSTLQYILGPDSGWQPIPLTEVITAAAIRKAYRKATLCVHPDKLQQKGASIRHKYICEKVFDLLREARNRFNSEER